MVFVLLYMKVVVPPQPPRAPQTQTTTNADGTANASGPTANDGKNSAPSEPARDAIGKFPRTDVGTIAVKRFESDQLVVEMTNRGAAITRVLLKEHYKTVDAKAKKSTDENDWISLFPDREHDRRPLELREVLSAGARPRWRLHEVDWNVKDERDAAGNGAVVFTFDAADGVQFEKRFTFAAGRHWIGVEVAARSRDASFGLENLEYELVAAGGFEDVTRGQYTNGPEASCLGLVGSDPEVKRRHHSELNARSQPEGVASADKVTAGWSGVGNLYFCAALIPEPPGGSDPSARLGDRVWIARSEANDERGVEAWYQGLLKLDRTGESFVRRTFKLYVGPKDPRVFDREDLAVMKPLLEEDFGSWTSLRWINKLLLAGLRFFESFFHNWGVAIVFLTILVRIVVFPITRAQQVSMGRYSQKMTLLKPKLDELRERHKSNPQKFAQEQMKLLREHKATPPLFGCLSSFITIPVFVGIFQILRTAIELRQAPFVWWIRDLSLPDALWRIPGIGIALNVLPILATGAFLAQMLAQPKPTDPQQRQQQKIMLIMPIVFGVMFYGYAAGLSLYMLVSSCWAIFESKVIRKYFLPLPANAMPLPPRK